MHGGHTKCMGPISNNATLFTRELCMVQYGRRPIVSLFLFAIFLMTEIRVYYGDGIDSRLARFFRFVSLVIS